MKERSRGDETQEDESLAEIQRHQRRQRELGRSVVEALETDLKLLKWLPPVT